MIWKIMSLPRFKLASLPTPMEKSLRLGERLGIDLWFKRDDVMELAMGGNKVRKLEFIFGHALSQGYDTVITTGAYHSNHVRLTIAAARRAGLEAYGVLYRHLPDVKSSSQGNILLDELLGGKIVYVESQREAEEMMQRIARDLESRGRKPYIIPAGGASEYGALGYALAALEILQQSIERGFRPRHIVHATGTCATQTGLVLGLKLLGASDIEVIGISNGRKADLAVKRCVDLAESTVQRLGLGIRVFEDDFKIYDQYTFGGYGVITREVVDTIREVAALEGLLLDPVYTAKAMYGLIDLAEKREIKGSTIFIHTGGTPIIFQYAETISSYMK